MSTFAHLFAASGFGFMVASLLYDAGIFTPAHHELAVAADLIAILSLLGAMLFVERRGESA